MSPLEPPPEPRPSLPNPDPTNPSRTVLLISGLSTLAALAFVWLVVLPALKDEPELFEVRTVRTEALDFLAERALPAPDEPREIELLPMDEATARLLYGQLQNASNNYDPLLGFRYRPDFERRIDYAEHPDGEWWLRTNGEGLRMDAELREPPADLRVLVIGDSHTDGICNNAEAYAHLLQERLAEALAPRTVEVLNAGKSGYSFYNYLAAPEAFAALELDLLVVCVYGGNDFTEVLMPHLYHQRLAPPPVTTLPEEVVTEAFSGLSAGVAPQGLMQSLLFEVNPHVEELSVDASLRVTRALANDCAARGLPWIGVYLPPMADVQPERLSEAYRHAEQTLGLGEQGRGVASRLGARWLALLAELEVPGVDLTPALRAEAGGERLYWKADHHIDLRAHRIVAGALAPRVLEVLRAQDALPAPAGG